MIDVAALSCPPRVWTGPTKVGTLGPLAVELAGEAGLVLDDWQAWSLQEAMGVRPDGRWSSFEVAECLPRQNGKGSILEARELSGLFLPQVHERLLTHTAHEYKTAQEHFLRIASLIDGLPVRYKRQVLRIREAHGSEAIEMRDGRRLRFMARAGGTGRGFSGDLVVLDEIMILVAASIANLVPTMAARKLVTVGGPQLWYTGSPGLGTDRSEVWERVRERGIAPEGSHRLFYAEWGAGAADDHTGEHVDPDDPAGWWQANPALHSERMDEEFIESERLVLGEDFPRERLGIWGGVGTSGIIDPDVWRGFADPDSRPGRVAFAVDVPPEGKRASIARVGLRADGRTHVEVDSRSGTTWAVDQLAMLARKRNAVVSLCGNGRAAALIPGLVAAGVEPVVYGTQEQVAACSEFMDRVDEDGIRHMGQAELAVAVDGARKRKVGNAWGLQRKDTSVDISPLVAVTLALRALKEDPPRRKTGRSLAV